MNTLITPEDLARVLLEILHNKELLDDDTYYEAIHIENQFVKTANP